MADISIKINLRQLESFVRTYNGEKSGKQECLVIPIDNNHLFRGEKGLYLNVRAFEIKNKSADNKSKDTHLLKQDLPKEVYEKMSKEQKEAMAILGGAIYWGKREPNPIEPDETLTENEKDDLPF
ncbi:hypothetical protein DF185_19835 [Marinifilum breve]|uniref:Uncharacterized protein n=1 Tax=Marinifilum breve TaxID=2184082 RepID=A0A2V3ZV38_9BACT|nr:hypothetical protein [Marinifilum breve]PXX96893.1 hypothetical protein DF185_19835 [Marinifilum breve]